MCKPQLIKGGIAVDDRGAVSFVNDFTFSGIKRFYLVEKHSRNFVRAWHGHKMEEKYVLVTKGTAIVAAVKIDDWEKPSKDQTVHKFVLSEKSPAILHIPNGYANGFMSLTDDVKIMFFSTASLAESAKDDYRYNARYWDPWKVEER